MSLEIIRAMLGWSAIINIGILLWWSGFLYFAKDWVYQTHSKFFKIERHSFDTIHYAGMLGFKLAIFVLNIVPYIAFRIVGCCCEG